MEGLATRWSLEFDNISLRVCDIDRGSFVGEEGQYVLARSALATITRPEASTP
jgi:hypothetical protein